MDIQGFEREKTLVSLTGLPAQKLMAFALASAERLIPLYNWFQQVEAWGNVRALEEGIEIGWRRVKGEGIADAEFANAILACEEATPDTDDFESPLASRALDAASAVSQALETCSNPTPRDAADAAEIAWECAFGLEQSRMLDAGVVHIADKSILEQASRGGFVQLEDDLQSRSIEWLRRVTITGEEVEAFRTEFAKLGG